MKIFTLDEANQLLPGLIPKLRAIKTLYSLVAEFKEPVKAAAVAGSKNGGGGMSGGTKYVKSLYDIGKLTTEIGDLGVQLKDYNRGLIDFPSMRGGKLVLLCWELDETPEILWWHEEKLGFSGRKPL